MQFNFLIEYHGSKKVLPLENLENLENKVAIDILTRAIKNLFQIPNQDLAIQIYNVEWQDFIDLVELPPSGSKLKVVNIMRTDKTNEELCDKDNDVTEMEGIEGGTEQNKVENDAQSGAPAPLNQSNEPVQKAQASIATRYVYCPIHNLMKCYRVFIAMPMFTFE